MEEKEKIEVVDLKEDTHEHKHHEGHGHAEHKHPEHKHIFKKPVKIEVFKTSTNPWIIVSAVLAVLLVAVAIMWLAKPGKSAAPTASAVKDSLIYMYSDACTKACDDMEPSIKKLAAESNIDFTKAKYFQPMPIPGFVLIHNNTVFLGPLTDENSFIISMCDATNNAVICNKAEAAEAELAELRRQEEQKALAGIPKKAKPEVELFVMSYCPYGVQAEAAMAPVVDLLGKKADIKVRFIASIGDTLDSVQSLHGPVEGIEDIRQLCVQKNYDIKKFWNYIKEINANCYSIYRGPAAEYEKCWKAAMDKAGIDIEDMEECIQRDGVDLLKSDMAITGKYSVSGSPTLIINGQVYNGQRNPEAYKTAICNAFTTPPAECNESLSSGTAAAAGNC